MRMPTPAGTSASHGLRQRNTAHPDRYGTIHVTNTISSTNGSGSAETPPKISAPTQSLRRAHSSDQRATSPPVVNGSASSMVCMTIATETSAPNASPAGNSHHADQRTRARTAGRAGPYANHGADARIRASAAPTRSPPHAATVRLGISSTQLAFAIERAKAVWLAASNTKVRMSSQ